VEAVRHAGPHKVLFGSDVPWLHPGVELHKVRLLHLPPDAEALILGGNAIRLLRGVRRAAFFERGQFPRRPMASRATLVDPAHRLAEIRPTDYEL
jgi:hypothetical protein